jgi:hypothetical protein
MLVVKVDDIGPVPPRGEAKFAFPVAHIPLRVFAHEVVIPRSMIGDPVKDNVHAQFVRGSDEVLKIG